MTIRSMQAVLDQCATDYLDAIVPEGVEIVFDIATVIWPDQCDDCGSINPEPMVRIGLYAEFPRPLASISMYTSLMLPYAYLSDGDIHPLEHALGVLWGNLQFMNVTSEVMPDLVHVAEEHDGQQGE